MGVQSTRWNIGSQWVRLLNITLNQISLVDVHQIYPEQKISVDETRLMWTGLDQPGKDYESTDLVRSARIR